MGSNKISIACSQLCKKHCTNCRQSSRPSHPITRSHSQSKGPLAGFKRAGKKIIIQQLHPKNSLLDPVMFGEQVLVGAVDIFSENRVGSCYGTGLGARQGPWSYLQLSDFLVELFSADRLR